jgi:predicted transposase YbfD/YdcC
MCLTHPPAKESAVQSTPPAAAIATPVAPLAIAPTSLAAAFAAVPDPRRAASVTYPLAAVLALAVAALLANHRSVLAIAEWGARQDGALRAALGFPTNRTPCQSTLQRLFRQLDGDALAATLAAYVAPAAAPTAALQGVAVDGKAQRGRLRFAADGCPIHALSAFCHESGLVLAQEPITADGDKAEAELTVAPALLARLEWRDRVLTGDALFCQRGLCRQVCAAGGDYVLLVKDNQPALHEAIALLFDPPADLAALPLLDRQEAHTLERGHGRTDDCRQLVASTDLNGYLEWPGLAQVFRLERTWHEHGVDHRALHYGITSLAPARADPARLLALRRGHWAIENRLHRQKDVAFGEDASLVHLGQGPTVLALVRDAALNLLHQAGIRQIAARLRLHAQHPEQAVALVVNPPPTHA